MHISRVDSLSLSCKLSFDSTLIKDKDFNILPGQGWQHISQRDRGHAGLIVWWGRARCWGLSTLDGDKHRAGLAALRLHNFLTKTWPLFH